ncbi:DUF5808 domain-containing protein [Rothia sp. ZJ932]|uniref:DUF5808 domain-containing protein n=1 Tax=Rothia sp. ZJ932 TaxID=2810516 RepID=UPI001966D930|nr:DUF5808 domain-containing protein [Rothia sp. ZJ932]QRZ62440.1 GntR family transcriptional regulator [Rothia sp. ZJ932]
MKITIHNNSSLPVYQQLHHQVADAVARGELQPGQPLLSVRALAKQLAVNPATIVKAYNLLKEESIIESRPRGKTVVASKENSPAPKMMGSWEEKLQQVIALGLAEGLSPERIERSVQELADRRRIDITQLELPDTTEHYKWGFIYINKEDPSIFVPKAIGYGWSLNFGNKWAWAVLLALTAPGIIIVLAATVLT